MGSRIEDGRNAEQGEREFVNSVPSGTIESVWKESVGLNKVFSESSAAAVRAVRQELGIDAESGEQRLLDDLAAELRGLTPEQLSALKKGLAELPEGVRQSLLGNK